MEPSLRAARAATFGYFVLDGTLMGLWLVQIPAVQKNSGIGNAALGSLLVLLGLGAFFGMQAAGRLADRHGTRVVVPVAGVLCAATLVLPGLARDPWTLAGALLAFGFANGALDVSMNAHAVHVEKAYGRPVMSAFHATFSIGGVIAALVAARTTGTSPAMTLGVSGAVGVLVALLPARALLPGPLSADSDSPAPSPTRRRGVPGRIWILAGLALVCMLCEGVANDWSTLEAKTVLGASAGTAAFAYGTYAAMMTVGRLLADRVSGRFGSASVLRYGSAAGAAGLAIVALSPWFAATLAGWALFGLGLSGCVPQLFSAAGHTDDAAAGTNVSRVAGIGYLGMLSGPAVIGWLTRLVPLERAFLVPALLLAAACLAAGILRADSDSDLDAGSDANAASNPASASALPSAARDRGRSSGPRPSAPAAESRSRR